MLKPKNCIGINLVKNLNIYRFNWVENDEFYIKKFMNVILKEIIIFIFSGSWTIFLAILVRSRHLLGTDSCLRIQLIQNKSSISLPLVGMNRVSSTRTQYSIGYQRDQRKLRSSSSTNNHKPYTDTF